MGGYAQVPRLALPTGIRLIAAVQRLFANGSQDINAAIDRLQLLPQRDLENAVRQAMASHAKSAVRALNWRRIIAGVAIVATFTVAAAGGGYWLGYRNSQGQLVDVPNLSRLLTAGDAVDWVSVIESNPPLSSVERKCSVAANGREVCQFTLWAPQPPGVPLQGRANE